MSLFKTDPLLAFCRLLAWAIFLFLAGSAVLILAFLVAALLNWPAALALLRASYPALVDTGLQPLLLAAMVLILGGLFLAGRFMLRLLAIVRSVALGEAFTLANAARIRAMAWISLAAMPVGFLIATLLSGVVERLGPRAPEAGMRISTFDGGFGYSQILMTLLLFVLARLFTQAAAMRDEIEGTV